MKERLKRICAAIVAVYIIIAAVPQTSVSAAPATYSKTSNSGTRNEVCTTLSGTSASSYYTGSYTYAVISNQSSSQSLSALRTLMRSTHSYKSSYNDCKNYADKTDCERNSGKMVSLYSSYTTNYNGSSINREHVWPKSLGNFETSGPGSDLHHIRPTEITPNSNRGSLRYGNVSGGKTSTGNASGKDAGEYNSSYFEPLDNVKGDVARICLYMYVRYGGESPYTCGSITNVFQSVDVLLDWMELDPVDTWEMGRNEVVQNIQGNRNVFIDYPEYAWLLFDEEIPENMTTPSGKASGGTGTGTGGGTGNQTERPTDPETEEPSGTVTGNGTLNAPLNTTQAYNANKDLAEASFSSDPFYVKGTITGIGEVTSYYKNVYISDGVTDILIYTLNLSNGITDIEVGDTIVVYGYFKNYYGTIEMATNNGTYVNVVRVEDETATESETEPDANTCEHIVTKLVGWVAGDCTNPGYSGDTYCATCDTKLFSGIVTDPTGEHVWAEWRHEIGATVEERECEACGEIEEREYTGPSEETNIATEPETDITTDTEAATDVGSETDTEVSSGTQNSDTESETVAATEPETKTEDYTEQKDPETSETAPTTVPEIDSGVNERETAEDKSDAPIDEVLEGCASSLAGGALSITVISIAALLAIRKKKE